MRGADCEHSRLGMPRVADMPLFHGPSGARRRSPAPSRPCGVTAKQRVNGSQEGIAPWL